MQGPLSYLIPLGSPSSFGPLPGSGRVADMFSLCFSLGPHPQGKEPPGKLGFPPFSLSFFLPHARSH